MAPSYTPNKIPGMALPSSLLKYEEPQQLQDIMQTQALQRAQQLKTQQDEIATQQKQQAFDQENRMRQGIQAEFEDGTGDVNNVLEIAKRIAGETGNFDALIEAEKAQRSRRDSITPYGEAERALLSQELGYDIPEGVSPSFVTTLINARGKNLYGQQLSDTNSYRQQKLNGTSPGGYEPEPDENGNLPDPKFGLLFTKALVSHDKINYNLDLLDSSLNTSDGNNPASPEFQKQKSYLAEIQKALKEKDNFGAALTGIELMLNNAPLPQILSNPATSAGEALVALGFGRDPKTAVATLKAQLAGELESQRIRYRQRRKPEGYNSNEITEAMGRAAGGVGGVNSQAQAPFQVPNAQFQGVDQATGLPIFKRGR